MSTRIAWWRQQEIITELHLASRYFQRLAMEFDQNENLSLPGDEGQMTEHIHQSVVLLLWRLETLNNQTSAGTHPLPEEHATSFPSLARQMREMSSVPEQSMTEQRSNPILHNKSD